MSFEYYQQFRDDPDLFPVYSNEEEEEDGEFIPLNERPPEECDCRSGCKYCLCTDW